MILARRVSKLFNLYTDQEIMDSMKQEREVELKRMEATSRRDIENVHTVVELAPQNANKIMEEDLKLCNLRIKKKRFNRRDQTL